MECHPGLPALINIFQKETMYTIKGKKADSS